MSSVCTVAGRDITHIGNPDVQRIYMQIDTYLHNGSADFHIAKVQRVYRGVCVRVCGVWGEGHCSHPHTPRFTVRRLARCKNNTSHSSSFEFHGRPTSKVQRIQPIKIAYAGHQAVLPWRLVLTLVGFSHFLTFSQFSTAQKSCKRSDGN
jgi:hypothetical protein